MYVCPTLSKEEIGVLRKKHLSPSLSLSYSSTIKHGLHIIRGKDQYLYASDGTRYLDCRNNIQHIGHSNDIITQCVTKQMSLLNTNTRYLHESTVMFAQQLTELFPSPLNYAMFVNSGSEANEIALRLALSYRKSRSDIIAFEHGYHGNTAANINVSHYKLIDQPSKPLVIPSNIHFIDVPDMYRGRHLNDVNFKSDPNNEDIVCDYYIDQLSHLIDTIDPNRTKIAAFIGESVIGCGGQIFLPRGYLLKYKQLLEDKYGFKERPLMIIDEVQTGFGRLGFPYFWGFQYNAASLDAFIPDIVTLGKSIGNGFPLACAVTNREILERFKENNCNQEYFNSFGGNPVAMMVGLNVLNIIKQNNYLQHVQMVGEYFINLLHGLQRNINGNKNRKVYIGDVRGRGLFIGIEFVKDLWSKTPAEHETAWIVNKLVEKPYCLLLSTDGPHENVIKIKPPICFTKANALTVVQSLEFVLQKRELFRLSQNKL